MIVVNITQFPVEAIKMKIKFIEVIVLKYEWETLSQVPAPAVDLLAVIKKGFDVAWILQLIVSHVVPLQEFFHRLSIVFPNCSPL